MSQTTAPALLSIGAFARRIAAAPREVYFTDDQVAADEPFCDIAFPIK